MTVETTCLANGLHVVTHAMPHMETVALGIWVKAGARDERPEENGIAHFLEHLAFKGTKRRSARGLLCPCAEGRLGDGAGHPRRHLHRVGARPWRA
jgi:predicted Zn-dependent peptidase